MISIFDPWQYDIPNYDLLLQSSASFVDEPIVQCVDRPLARLASAVWYTLWPRPDTCGPGGPRRWDRTNDGSHWLYPIVDIRNVDIRIFSELSTQYKV